ncbi:hypothetical protein OESDEN_10187 [Oesophagostomum dentatum]|uniref:Uncharacterized protein n=1 Tax=Oesophagostomum dentatum TaxID=61180 RepID=A0A0B1SXD5_OESDE|nr:hypothetical protein OESDEN_10187 [Oesophagostomum dentatum]
MSDCYSDRMASFPIEINFELRCLASGSLLILFSVRNKTAFELKGWSLSASFSPTLADDSGVGSFSQCITLGTVVPGEEFSSELFVSQQHLRLPVSVRLHLIKSFDIAGEEKCILIELDREFLSLRDLIYSADSVLQEVSGEERSSVKGNFSLRIPCALVDLLSGCPDDNDPVNVLRILLPRHQFRSLAPGTSSTDAILVVSPFQKHPLHIEVSKEGSYFVVNIILRDGTLRNRVKESLQLYLINLSLRVRKRPVNSVSIVTDGNSVEEIFDNVVSAFS